MKDKSYKNVSPMKKRQSNPAGTMSMKIHYPIIFGVLIFVGIVYYLKYSSTSLYTDRSENFNVKIIPDNLDDNVLGALDHQQFSYVAVIDAGSSGCRAHIYRYGKLGSIQGKLYILPNHESKKLKPGLSSFAQNPSEAGSSLVNLINFVKEKVPENYWKDTPIWLKATAGLRLLDKSTSEQILDSVRKFLKDPTNSPFYFTSNAVQLISGRQEGAFGWIAFNYLKRVIGPKKEGNVLPYAGNSQLNST